MKKVLAFLVLGLILLSSGCSKTLKPEIDSGKNDIVISKTKKKGITYTTYIHEQTLDGGLMMRYKVYETPSETQELFVLPSATPVKFHQIQIQTQKDYETVWYMIEANNKTGWIRSYTNPYKNGNWSILEKVTIDGLEKTVRKAAGGHRLLLECPTNIYSAPSENSEIICSFTTKDEKSVTVTAMTEEHEKSKRYSYHEEIWVKIRLDDIEGWVFGDCLDTGRGGSKYEDVPSSIIYDKLGECML